VRRDRAADKYLGKIHAECFVRATRVPVSARLPINHHFLTGCTPDTIAKCFRVARHLHSPLLGF